MSSNKTISIEVSILLTSDIHLHLVTNPESPEESARAIAWYEQNKHKTPRSRIQRLRECPLMQEHYRAKATKSVEANRGNIEHFLQFHGVATEEEYIEAATAHYANHLSTQLKEPKGHADNRLLGDIASEEAIHVRLHTRKPLIKAAKFSQGKRGKSPIRKEIERLLKKNPRMKNAEIWAAIKAKPPRGWTAMHSPKLGDYFASPSGGSEGDMGYRRFSNVCAEIRKEQKNC